MRLSCQGSGGGGRTAAADFSLGDAGSSWFHTVFTGFGTRCAGKTYLERADASVDAWGEARFEEISLVSSPSRRSDRAAHVMEEAARNPALPVPLIEWVRKTCGR
jgi:hypothetical protein